METWMRWNRILQESEGEPGTSGGGENSDDDPPQVSPEVKRYSGPVKQTSQDSGTGIESPFAGTRFEGMDPKDVAERLALAEETVKEQGRALNEARRSSQPVQQQTPPQDDDVEISSNEFFQNPGEALKKRDEALRNKLLADMKEIISPLGASLQERETERAWDRLERQFPDQLPKYRNYIEQALESRAIDFPTYETLLAILKYAIGEAAVGSGTFEQPQNTNRGTGNQSPPTSGGPPQHPASRQPLSPQEREKPAARPLTESEKKLARHYKMTDDEFRAWQDTDERDVIGSDIGKEG